jgi:hypothetical protein
MATFTGSFDDDKRHTASRACIPNPDRQRARAALLACVVFGSVCLMPAREVTAQTAHNHPSGAFDGWVVLGGVQIITGDFNGDLKTDIGLVRREPGWNTVPVALSTGSGFDVQNWSARENVLEPAGGEFARDWATRPGVQVITGDFGGRDNGGNPLTDIALVGPDPALGWRTIPVALSTGAGFEIQNRLAREDLRQPGGVEFARDPGDEAWRRGHHRTLR